MSTTAETNAVAIRGSKKPKYSRFTQQELPACKPLLTPVVAITTFFVVAVVFIPIGVACLLASKGVVEVTQRYDDACLGSLSNEERASVLYNQSANPVPACSLTIAIPKTMKAPVYVYYQLTNYYQNHRRYVKSRSDSQLRGDNVTGSGLDACSPEAYLNGSQSQVIVPCGLVAWSYFNDTYAFAVNGAPLTVNETNISWKSDRDAKFGSVLPQNFNTVAELRGGGNLTAPLNQDEHLIVWMRTAALPTFRKLWGRIETDIAAGASIVVSVNNIYNTYPFGGQKSVVLSTTSWLGGKNDFLGVAYIAVGALCFALALLFFALHLANPRPLGDTSYLSWNRRAMPAGNN